jgi:hypothetical protein
MEVAEIAGGLRLDSSDAALLLQILCGYSSVVN